MSSSIKKQGRLLQLTSLLIAAWTLGGLAACGGGGGGGGGVTNPPPPPPPPTRNAEVLAFMASDGVSTNGQNELYTVADDGSGEVLVSQSLAVDRALVRDFALSPDGQWVAYLADPAGFGQISLFVNSVSGGTPVRVSQEASGPRRVASFQWSPDSSQLVYAGNFDIPLTRGNAAREVFVVNRDGSGMTKINGGIGATPTVDVANPQWSPDGRYIVQEVFRFANNSAAPAAFALNVHDTTGTARNSRRLVEAETRITNVRWSGNSQRLSFTADQATAGIHQALTINVDGRGITRVTDNGWINSDARWSPDSSELAYLDHPSSPFPADLVVSAGTGGATDRVLVFLSPNNREVRAFEWSPDGLSIAYIANADTDNVYELFVVPADGSGTGVKISQPLMPNTDVLEFAWSPDGQRIAYTADQVTDTVRDLYVVSRTGTGLAHLSAGLAGEEVKEFDWSNDGQRVRFSTGPQSRTVVADRMYAIAPNGSSRVQVTNGMLDGPLFFSKW